MRIFHDLNFRVIDGPKLNDAVFSWCTDQFFMILGPKSGLKIYLDDILFVSKNSDDLELICYPLIKNQRQRIKAKITGNECAEFERELKQKMIPRIPPHLPGQTKNRRTLILVNPFSGQKKALLLFENVVKPIFDEAEIECQIKHTSAPNHAMEIAQELNLDEFEFITVVSGDGLVNEVISGLLTRADRDRALKMPILHIPGGTGNALAASIAFKSGEPFSARGGFCREMALMAVRPEYRQLRLHHFEGEMDGNKCMFLSAVWGLMADIDICSERFRWAGMIRLHIEATLRIMQLPSVARYRGKISYLPIEDDAILGKTRLKWDEVRRKFGKNHFSGGSVDFIENVEHFRNMTGKRKIEEAFESQKPIGNLSLKDPVPDNWVKLDGEFVYVAVSSLSHLGSDLPYMPCSKLEEDILFLSICDWKVVRDRLQVATMFINMDTSQNLDYPCLQVIPVRACRIEPVSDAGGYVALDGEPCAKGSTFQVLSSDLTATVVSRRLRD